VVHGAWFKKLTRMPLLGVGLGSAMQSALRCDWPHSLLLTEPQCAHGGMGVMRFVRLVAAEGLLARAMRLSTYEIISPLTPEPAGFPPSPARGEGDMR